MRALALCLAPILGFLLAFTADHALAQDGPEPPDLGLAAPASVVESGLLKHILPRFSLKTGIRVVHDGAGPMALAAAPPGVAVFEGQGTTYYLRSSDDARQRRFRDWMISEIGKRTIDSFERDGEQVFSASVAQAAENDAVDFDGDAALGADLSLIHCGRCHVIGPQNRMKGLGSTPSFAVLRGLSDWETRFQQFYVLKPHAAFTQITGITAPFDAAYPSPIVPVEISQDELDHILSFVATTDAADLGAPLQLQ